MRIDSSYVRSFFSKAVVVSCLAQREKIAVVVALTLGYLAGFYLAEYRLTQRFPKARKHDAEKFVVPRLTAQILDVSRPMQNWKNFEPNEQNDNLLEFGERFVQIFSYLPPRDKITCSRVCVLWHRYANNESLWQVPEEAFGKERWGKIFKNIPIPPLPHQAYYDFYQITHTSGYVPGTCLLTPILESIHGRTFTSNEFIEYVKAFHPDYKGRVRWVGPDWGFIHFLNRKWTIAEKFPLISPHWTLLLCLSDDLSCHITAENEYPPQIKLEKYFPGFELPNFLDTIIALFMVSNRFENQGARIDCQETVQLQDPPFLYGLKITVRKNNLIFDIRQVIGRTCWVHAIQRRYFLQPQTI